MKIFISCKDHSVTQETFNLLYDPTTELLITDPQPKNLDKYYESDAYISHTDSKKTAIDKLYQFIKRINIQFKLNLINRYTKNNKTLLDVGAGTGDFLLAAQNNSWSVIGVEPNKNASAKALAKQVTLFQNLESVPQQKYNIITLWHVLEHLPDLNDQITKLLALLDEQGTLIVAVPNYKSYDAKFYKEHWAAYDVPRHLWHFSKTSIDHIFKKHGMRIIKTKPMFFDAFYVSILSEKYRTGKSQIIKALWTGIQSNLHGLHTKEYSSQIYILQRGQNSI